MLDREPIIIVYPTAGSIFYEALARRLMVACEEIQRKAVLRSSVEVRDMDEDQLTGATLAIVNPLECSHKVGNSERFFSRLSAARKRIMVLAEAVGIHWFERQFKLPLQYDMLLDVGFASQEDELRDFDVSYRFLFNGPDRREQQTIPQLEPSRRTIPWAFVGHIRRVRAQLAVELMEHLGPAGFVFLPSDGVVREGHGTISPSSLASVLSRTEYYVWNSYHEFAYYESFRFREAVLAGAMPCKIDSRANWEKLEIPGVFPSVQALCERIQGEGFSSMQERAKEFYLSRGTLSDHLEEVLGGV